MSKGSIQLKQVKEDISKIQGFIEFLNQILAFEKRFLERVDDIEMLGELIEYLELELTKLIQREVELEVLEQKKQNQKDQHQLGDD